MDRRKYLKTLAAGTVTTGIILSACGPEKKKEEVSDDLQITGKDRTPAEVARYKKIMADKFFNEHEMKTLTTLGDIIIPKDEVSGSASDAGVPAFLEFIVKDMPRHQTPLRGGLKWLDIQCMKRFTVSFADCSHAQQIEIVDEIAYPDKAKPNMQQGVSFFNALRDLVATGFYTSKIGLKDIGYAGNQRTQWDGVPQEVLTQYNIAYEEKLLPLYVKFEND